MDQTQDRIRSGSSMWSFRSVAAGGVFYFTTKGINPVSILWDCSLSSLPNGIYFTTHGEWSEEKLQKR